MTKLLYVKASSRRSVVSLGADGDTSKATGKCMHAPFAHVWRVADGKLKRFDMYKDTLLVDRAMQP